VISSTEASSEEASKWSAGHQLPVWYLISRRENNRLKLLTIPSMSSRETVPVFRDGQSAQDFLLRGGFNPEWRIRETTAGEMTSLLLTCLADVGQVALDPPAIFATADDMGLELTDKKEFIAALMGEPLLVAAR
jgi:hypothetical protein